MSKCWEVTQRIPTAVESNLSLLLLGNYSNDTCHVNVIEIDVNTG